MTLAVVMNRTRDRSKARRRIAPEIGTELVHLVQHENGVPAARAPQSLHDLTGERADVRPPMTTDLRLVAHAAQRDTMELASQRTSDRTAERRLANAGRSHEAEDGILALGPDLLDGEVLEDALLDLLQALVVLVQDGPGPRDVDRVARLVLPRHREQPVEIGPSHRVLGGRRRHLGKAVQLTQRLLARLLGHTSLLDLLAQAVDLLRALVALAQLFLDRLELLAQVVLALRLRHFGLNLGLDLRTQLEDFGLLAERRHQRLQACLHVDGLEQLLLDRQRERRQ